MILLSTSLRSRDVDQGLSRPPWPAEAQALDSFVEGFHVDVEDWGDVKREELRDEQAANHGQS